MIERPDNLDTEHESRVRALLDAFIAIGTGSLMLHETSIAHLPYIVWSWAQDRGLKISVCPMVRCDGTAYESWDIGRFGDQIHIFPKEIGLLSPKSDRFKERVAEIQREAQARIKELMS